MSFDALLEADLESSSRTVHEGSSDSSLATVNNSDFLTIPMPAENALLAHRIPFAYLCGITNKFSLDRFIDKGGFATVYLGVTFRSHAKLAVKKLKAPGQLQLQPGGNRTAAQLRGGSTPKTQASKHHRPSWGTQMMTFSTPAWSIHTW